MPLFQNVFNAMGHPVLHIFFLQDDASDSDENIFNSPFIKKPHQPKVRHHSDNTTPLPEKEFSFISSNKDPKGKVLENYKNS